MAFFSIVAWLPSGTIANLAATVFTIRATLAAHRHLRLFHASAIAPVVVTVRVVLLPLFGAEALAPLSIRLRGRASRRHGACGPAPALRRERRCGLRHCALIAAKRLK